MTTFEPTSFSSSTCWAKKKTNNLLINQAASASNNFSVRVQLYQVQEFVCSIELVCMQYGICMYWSKFNSNLFCLYLGLFNIVQLPRLNSLLCHMPDTLDFAFKLRRKKFTIEVCKHEIFVRAENVTIHVFVMQKPPKVVFI